MKSAVQKVTVVLKFALGLDSSRKLSVLSDINHDTIGDAILSAVRFVLDEVQIDYSITGQVGCEMIADRYARKQSCEHFRNDVSGISIS